MKRVVELEDLAGGGWTPGLEPDRAAFLRSACTVSFPNFTVRLALGLQW